MGNANWTFIIIKIMISVLFSMIIKMKDENDTVNIVFFICSKWSLGNKFHLCLSAWDTVTWENVETDDIKGYFA